MNSKPQVFVGLFVLAAGVSPMSQAWAMGSGKPNPTPSPPPYSLPNPLRYVVVRPIANVAGFETPNQVTTTVAQAQSSLSAILDGVVNNAGFSVIQGGDVNSLEPCGKHLELWPAVTDFTLNDTTIDVQFGYNNTGSINVGQPQATAEDTLTIGDVKMEFTLYECDNDSNGSCTSVGPSTSSDNSVLGNNFSFKVTWSQFTIPGSILNQANLVNALQRIMMSGVSQIISSPQMAEVPWNTTITIANSDGSYTVPAGRNANLGANQYFTIYEPAPSSSGSTDACGVLQAVACAYTKEVDPTTSVLKTYLTLSEGQGVPIAKGFVVEVGGPACTPASAKNSTLSPGLLLREQSQRRI